MSTSRSLRFGRSAALVVRKALHRQPSVEDVCLIALLTNSHETPAAAAFAPPAFHRTAGSPSSTKLDAKIAVFGASGLTGQEVVYQVSWAKRGGGGEEDTAHEVAVISHTARPRCTSVEGAR